MSEKATGDAVTSGTASPVVVSESPKPPETRAEVTAEIREELSALKAAIAEQKAKGEITAASESTLQALYEELKLGREDLATLKELRVKVELLLASVSPAPATDKFKKWLPW